MQFTTKPEVKRNSENVLTVSFSDIAAGWEHWLLLTSDRHHDSVHCNRGLEKEHLELCKERGGSIIDCGDLFDAMQGRYDPRRNYDSIRPEYKSEKYLDMIVTDAAKFYKPYADNFILLGRGNHDQAIIKNNNTDLIQRLAYAMGGDVQVGGYGGWIKFLFNVQKTKRMSKKLKYFHGAGGGGPVTRGVIQTNRQAVYLPDADIVVNGHTHDAWIVPIERERISDAGRLYHDHTWFIRTPTYNDDYNTGADGWHVERWGAPKPMGCAWVRLYMDKGNKIRVQAFHDLAE